MGKNVLFKQEINSYFSIIYYIVNYNKYFMFLLTESGYMKFQ